MRIPLLGQIPIVQSICESGDAGKPAALNDSITGEAFRLLATKLVEQVDLRNKNLTATKRVEVHGKK
jgi:ATP-binding protein involved in chromosome partitioning